MLRIYLVRHGQDEDNAHGILNGHRDTPLTATGIAQAEEVAGKITAADLRFDHVYTSPLQRAAQTADIISRAIDGPPPETLSDLIERDFGMMTGVEQSKITAMCVPHILKTETITYFLDPEGAETFPALIKRAGKLLDTIKQQHADGNVLLVTHGDLGKMIYAAYYDLPWKEVLQLFHFGNSELLLLSPDSQAGEAHVFTILQHNH